MLRMAESWNTRVSVFFVFFAQDKCNLHFSGVVQMFFTLCWLSKNFYEVTDKSKNSTCVNLIPAHTSPAHFLSLDNSGIQSPKAIVEAECNTVFCNGRLCQCPGGNNEHLAKEYEAHAVDAGRNETVLQ